jgi:hypothetical protein
VGECMSSESGAEYLRRLKQDAMGPVAQPAVTASVEEIHLTNERRGNPRYKCEGSAEFRADESDVRTWGTFTDLSVSGCYIEMTATYPVGAIVNLALELNGMRAEVKGEVRVSYPFLGIGVAFREVSPQNQRQLQQMVRSLLPASHLTIAKAPLGPAAASPPNLSLPVIVNAGAALQALVEFFENHVDLTREEFVRRVRQSPTSIP